MLRLARQQWSRRGGEERTAPSRAPLRHRGALPRAVAGAAAGGRRGRHVAPRPERPVRVAALPRGTHHQGTRRSHSHSYHGKAMRASEFGQEGRGVCVTVCRVETSGDRAPPLQEDVGVGKDPMSVSTVPLI